MYNSILFNRRGRNVLAWIDGESIGDDLLVISGAALPVDSLVLCRAETDGKRVTFKAISKRIILLEDGDSTTINKLYSTGALESVLKSICTI